VKGKKKGISRQTGRLGAIPGGCVVKKKKRPLSGSGEKKGAGKNRGKNLGQRKGSGERARKSLLVEKPAPTLGDRGVRPEKVGKGKREKQKKKKKKKKKKTKEPKRDGIISKKKAVEPQSTNCS